MANPIPLTYFRGPMIGKGVTNTIEIKPLSKEQAADAASQMPDLRFRPRSSMTGGYGGKMISTPQSGPIMVNDQNKPVGTDAMGNKIVGNRTLHGLGGYGGNTIMPNAAAPGYGGYRGLMQGAHIGGESQPTPGGAIPDYGPIGPSSHPLSPDYGGGALGQIHAGSAASGMGADLAASARNSQYESMLNKNEKRKGTPYYQNPASFGGFRRRGGPVHRGKAYIVGENGPELVIPNHSGTVIPAGATDRIMRPRSAFDSFYARKSLDPLTNMSYAPSQFDIQRKRQELQQYGDMEALAEFDNLIHARGSGDPYSIGRAEDSFRRFRAARQFAANQMQQGQPQHAPMQPQAPQDVSQPIPSYQSGTVTQTPLGRVLHGSVYGTGSSTLMPKPYTPPTLPQPAPFMLRAPDYGDAGSLDSVMGSAEKSLLDRRAEEAQRTAPPPETIQAAVPAWMQSATRQLLPPTKSKQRVQAVQSEASLPSQISQNVQSHLGGSPLGQALGELKDDFASLPSRIYGSVKDTTSSAKKKALQNPQFADSILGQYLRK